jgi:very-short-patch-repair endonuclease
MREGRKINAARRLRRDANAPEAVAWATLREFRKSGFVVRRRHPIGRFIVDFAIIKSRLVVEIDGGVHRLSSVQYADAEREAVITALGWRVIRISPGVALSRDHLTALIQRELAL